YERHHRWLQIDGTLPTGLFETTPEIILDQMRQSDFVFLFSTNSPPVWPFDRQVLGLLPKNRAWCDEHLMSVGSLDAVGNNIAVYERRDLTPRSENQIGLTALLEKEIHAPVDRAVEPPAAPKWLMPESVRWSTLADFSFRLRAAYSPIHYCVEGLPPEVHFDPRSGRLSGRLPHPGTYVAKITAANSAGSITRDVTFRVEDRPYFAEVNVPAMCAMGAPVEITFEAFDSSKLLNFVDITDLTTIKTLDRLVPAGDEKQSWLAQYRTTFTQPGVHKLAFRFVRFDSKAKEQYTFFDILKDITVEAR
ncbi:MAG TPA: putative Ig domain-containing protein, partial [Opitutaceae bacterium]|nr:putative Ig domain-containing protein [Opitutaceae bacterium]